MDTGTVIEIAVCAVVSLTCAAAIILYCRYGGRLKRDQLPDPGLGRSVAYLVPSFAMLAACYLVMYLSDDAEYADAAEFVISGPFYFFLVASIVALYYYIDVRPEVLKTKGGEKDRKVRHR
jgi:hypothetical protein